MKNKFTKAFHGFSVIRLEKLMCMQAGANPKKIFWSDAFVVYACSMRIKKIIVFFSTKGTVPCGCKFVRFIVDVDTQIRKSVDMETHVAESPFML